MRTTERAKGASSKLFESDAWHGQLVAELDAKTSESGHHTDSAWWADLNAVARRWARAASQAERASGSELQDRQRDSFASYAEMYDSVIGQPCLDSFMARFIRDFFREHVPEPERTKLLSIGCGTGLVEAHMVSQHGVRVENLLGFDLSEAQIGVARKRGLRAEVGDCLAMSPELYGEHDVAFAGLNVFHYLPGSRLAEAIGRTASVLRPGGFFIGDFICPDHIRWYPHVLFGGACRRIISLRTPRLVEASGRLFQESSIVNLDFRNERVALNDAGTHRRHLPAMLRVRQLFEGTFEHVELFDAASMKSLPRDADTCASTRYVVVARKSGR
jgi:SAM-dependent methyltransferase